MLGKVESGKLDKGEALMLMPNKVTTWLTSGACSQLRYREMFFFSVLILINITLRALFHLELPSLCQKLKGYDYLKYNMAAVNSGFVVSCGNS